MNVRLKTPTWLKRGASVLLGVLFALQPLAARQNPARHSETQKPVETSTPQPKKSSGILGLVPTYGVQNARNLPPLTPREKLRLAIDQFANPFAVAEAAVKAEYYRGLDPEKKIGRGGTGYLKQWGASYLDEISGATFNSFLYPTLLRQDPRYYRKGHGSIASRVAYSLSRVLVTRTDAGQPQFNASMVLGDASATIVSNAYYPRRARGVDRTLINFGWSLVGSGASNAFKEFWPDIAQRLK